jgi:hypothetical protein
MYGVMRERARNRPMQIAGLAISALATVAAANLLMSGFGNFVGAFAPPEPATLTTIAPEDEALPPVEFITPDDEVKLPTTTVLATPPEDFVYKEDLKETIAVKKGEAARVGDPEAVVGPPKTIRIAPKLRSLEKPPYPATEQRARNEGNTSLGLCIDARACDLREPCRFKRPSAARSGCAQMGEGGALLAGDGGQRSTGGVRTHGCLRMETRRRPMTS